VATLTYVYCDSTAVLGPLATHAEPHSYDLCGEHAQRLTAPRGWEIVRLSPEFQTAPPSHDDLLALADAVREASRPLQEPVAVDAAVHGPGIGSMVEVGRRGHLRVLRDSQRDGEPNPV
jgi:ribosomal protein S4E